MAQIEPNMQPTTEAPNNRGRAMYWLILLFIAAGAAWLLFWLFYLQFHESTDDAYVNGNMINVSTVIPGTPIAFFADNTDFVVEGQILVLLDSTEYEVEFKKQLSILASTVQEVSQIYENVETQKANVENKKIQLGRAIFDYNNRKQLIPSQAISNEEFIHSQDAMHTAESDLKQAESLLKEAQDRAGHTPLESHPLIEQQKSAVREAFYRLSHCTVRSPANGYVAQRSVEVGQWTATNTPLMAIIPINYMWVDANFKETQLKYMRIGQSATVYFDLYGSGKTFQGKVLGIASGTGSVFSIIPPQNATGNWIKIVQRLPVRIGIKMEEEFPLRLGISATVDVDITDTSLPMLAQTPSHKPVAVTKVFDLDFSELEDKMSGIIQDFKGKSS